MGLFDVIKDKAAELFSGAGDKVNELTGTELPGADAVDQLADNVTDTAQDLSGSVSEAADGAVTEATDPDK